MSSLNLKYTNLSAERNSAKRLKSLTSLVIKKQKTIHAAQTARTCAFLNSSKSRNTKDFIENNPYLIGLKFIETPNFSKQEFFLRLGVTSHHALNVGNLASCQELYKLYGADYLWSAKFLSTGNVYLLSFGDEVPYLNAIKSLLSFEDSATAPMCALLFSVEKSLWFDLQKFSPNSSSARAYYKQWDSSKSILIELTRNLESVALGFTAAFQNELVAGSALSLPEVTILPSFIVSEN